MPGRYCGFSNCRTIFLFFFHSSKGFSNRDCLYVKQEKQVYEKTSIIILLFKTKTNEQMGQILIG